MKATSYIRIFITVAVMIATACSEPEIVPQPTYSGNPQIQPTEFHTWVTSWQGDADQGFTALVGAAPHTDLSKAKFYWIQYEQKVLIETLPDATKIPTYMEMYEWYLWVSVDNNELMVYFKGGSSTQPPTPLEIVVEY